MATAMDEELGVKGEGACQRRLAEIPPVLQLCFGALGEARLDIHNLIGVRAGRYSHPHSGMMKDEGTLSSGWLEGCSTSTSKGCPLPHGRWDWR